MASRIPHPHFVGTLAVQLLHPPLVVRSAWVEDCVQARRKLPVAKYMVDGVFVQRRTLTDTFGATPAPADGGLASPPQKISSGTVAATPVKAGVSNNPTPELHSYASVSPGGHRDGVLATNASTSKGRGDLSPSRTPFRKLQEFSTRSCAHEESLPDDDGEQPAPLVPRERKSESKPENKARVTSADGKLTLVGANGEYAGYMEPQQLEEMGLMGEGGRTTKDDPEFMKTFFQYSRLHFIGVA